MSFNLDYPFTKPVCKRVLNKSVNKIGEGSSYWNHSVGTSIDMFEEACWNFTDPQYINVLANIITTRAYKLGGGQLIDQLIKELQKRKPIVVETMLE